MDMISRNEAILKGLSKYFTGSTCRNGHISERYVQSGTCQECIRESRPKSIIPARMIEILPPEQVMKLHLTRVENDRLKIDLQNQRLLLAAQNMQLRLENRLRRQSKEHREIVCKAHLIDVYVFIDPNDFESVVTMIWGFALVREPTLRRDDIVSGRELKDNRFVMRCFPGDKEEILRVTGEMYNARHGVTVAETELVKHRAQLVLTAQAEDNGQPEHDPR